MVIDAYVRVSLLFLWSHEPERWAGYRRSQLAGHPPGRQSPEIYSRLARADAQQRYDDVIGDFPV